MPTLMSILWPALPTEGKISMVSIHLIDVLITVCGHHESMGPKCQHLAPKLDSLVAPSQPLHNSPQWQPWNLWGQLHELILSPNKPPSLGPQRL